jgi:hypothetical protein
MIPPEKYFYAKDGQVIKDVTELSSSLKKMTEDIYYFHVNENKNDFSNWIFSVFNDITLANEVRKAHRKEDTIKILDAYLNKQMDNKFIDTSSFLKRTDQIEKKIVSVEFEEKEQSTELLKKAYVSHLEEYKKKVSELRKKGKNTKQAELYITMIPSRIKIFESTSSEQDAIALLHLFYAIQLEIKEVDGEQVLPGVAMQ